MAVSLKLGSDYSLTLRYILATQLFKAFAKDNNNIGSFQCIATVSATTTAKSAWSLFADALFQKDYNRPRP